METLKLTIASTDTPEFLTSFFEWIESAEETQLEITEYLNTAEVLFTPESETEAFRFKQFSDWFKGYITYEKQD